MPKVDLAQLASEADAYLRQGVPAQRPKGVYTMADLAQQWQCGQRVAYARIAALRAAGKIKPTTWLDTDAAGRPCRRSGYVVG